MTRPEAAVSVTVLRAAAKSHAEEVGLRTAAAQIGMSFSGLRTFLEGTTPHPSTVAKLRAWYATTPAGRALTAAQARANLAALLEGVPEEQQAVVRREFLDAVERACAEAGVKVPGWVRELRED
jgi:hypothetical protein